MDRRARAQVDERVRDELPRTVIGHLAAAVDLHERHAVVAQHVLPPAGETQRVDRRMLGEPELVFAVRVAQRP